MAKSKTAASKSAPAAKEKSISELINVLAEKTGFTKSQAKGFLDAHAEVLLDELKTTGSVQLAGIGKLKMGTRAERKGRNPATGAEITIPAAKTVKFSAAKKFKDGLA